MKIRNAILGAGLWVVAAGASALSLGASRGSVVLGSSLDLTFDVQPDAGTDVASSCVTASVKTGDIPLGDAQVRLTPLAAGVRVQVRNAVDEPVVLVTLAAGCTGRITRTYTFLADPPQAVQRGNRTSAGVTPLASVPLVMEAARDRSAPPVEEADTGTSRALQPPRPPYRTPSVRKEARPATAVGGGGKTSSRSARAVAPKDVDRSRLVMEPLDTWLEVPLTLRSTVELPQAPASESSAQREQAAALWRSLNRDSQEALQDLDAQRKLEGELTELRARATRDHAAVVELQRQLDDAQGRFDPWFVYGLVAALAAALGGVAWTWRRSSQTASSAARSWRESVAVSKRKAEPKDVVELERLEEVPSHPADRWGRPVSPSTVAKSVSPVTTSVDILLEPDHRVHGAADFAETPVVANNSAEPVPQHIINPEELFDIQQQAEFFVSVGEHDQAVEVLLQHIAEHEETSPVAYLELLRLYRTLSRAADFNVLRQRFMRHFNAQVPEFASFDRHGKSLDQYLDALAEIEAQWSSSEVLHVLEKYMFYSAGEGRKTPFDLAAYDDLLMLLAIAQTTPASARGAPPPRKRTTPVPQSFEAAAAHALSALTPLSPLDTTPDFPLDSLAAALEFGFEPPAPPAAPVPPPVKPDAEVTAQEEEAAKGPETMPQAPLLAELVVSAPAPLAGASRAYRPVATAAAPAPTFALDIDLSDPVPITISDLPPVPVTPPPPPGQPIGFGSSNDLMELSLELEPFEPGEKKL